ncbi:hypothetical protein Aperf_G00000024628 [Anoplocephala perfoliata]
MPAPLVYMILIIIGVRITALEHSTQQQPLDTGGDIFVDTFIDHLISLLRLFLPDELTLDESPLELIIVRNATVYGLRHIERGGPTVLKAYSTPDNDYINCILTLSLKDYFKVDGFFQISMYDSKYRPATMELFGFIVEINLTLTLPKTYKETSELLLHFDGVANVEIERLDFTKSSKAKEEPIFDLLTSLTSSISSGTFRGFVESKIARCINLTIKRLNNRLQERIEEETMDTFA